MALIWTAAQLALLAPVSLAAFFGYRILLGASEGPALPTALHAAYKWFPDRDRPLVTAILEAGIPIGSALAALTATRMIVTAGWHVAFGVLGLASLLWCCVWLLVDRAAPQPEVACNERHASRSRTIIGVMIAGFAVYWVSTLAVIWLPSFLQVAVALTKRSSAMCSRSHGSCKCRCFRSPARFLCTSARGGARAILREPRSRRRDSCWAVRR
jgi:MFS transporter, ACS family, D-galactonate transporter